MEIFRKTIRHIVLKIKTSEKRQQECKENLAIAYRTMQRHSISNASIKSYTKQILSEIKANDEWNKCFRKELLELLIKIKTFQTESTREAKSDHAAKLSVFFGHATNQNALSSIEIQNQPVSSGYEVKTQINTRKIPDHEWTSGFPATTDTKNRKSSVNLNNHLITFTKFLGKRIIIRVGVG